MDLIRRARSGFTIIEMLIVIFVITILVAIAIPNLLADRQEAGDETSCIGSLRIINAAEATYRSANATYGTLTQLAESSLIDPALGAASTSGAPRSGYSFSLSIVSNAQYWVYAEPVYGAGSDVFYTDEAGPIFENSTPGSPSGDASGSLIALGGTWEEIGN
jgi:prepilin-type N-terminal cleavage/methylation domain-containing protein